jgi:hypothetical protein
VRQRPHRQPVRQQLAVRPAALRGGIGRAGDERGDVRRVAHRFPQRLADGQAPQRRALTAGQSDIKSGSGFFVTVPSLASACRRGVDAR